MFWRDQRGMGQLDPTALRDCPDQPLVASSGETETQAKEGAAMLSAILPSGCPCSRLHGKMCVLCLSQVALAVLAFYEPQTCN